MERLILLRNDIRLDHILVYLQPQTPEDCNYFLVNNAHESPCIFFLHDTDANKDPQVHRIYGPANLGAC